MSIPRKALLKHQTKSESDRKALILSYHLYLRPINKIAKNLQPLLNKDPTLTKSSLLHQLYHIVNLLTSNFYLHLRPYQMKVSSQGPFRTNL